jgi:hypothetical protein
VLNELAAEGKVRMLYEPASNLNPIPQNNSTHHNIPCTASLSPHTTRYKEFLKQPYQLAPHVMSCPTTPELVAIVKFFGILSNKDAAAQRNSLLKLDERLKSAGPFLRVLLMDDDSFEIYEQETKSAVSIVDLNLALRTIESDEIDGVPPQSHRVARYVTPKARDGDYITKELRPASDIVSRRTGPCP